MDIIFTLQSTTDGSLLTGQAANTTVYLSIDGGSYTTSTNAAQEIGRGAYKLTLTSAEAAFTDVLLYQPVCNGAQTNTWAIDKKVSAEDNANAVWGAQNKEITGTVTINSTQAATLATAAALSGVADNVSAVKVKTDNLPASPAATGDIPSVASIQSGLAKTSDLTGLSTFNPLTDTVTINSTQAASMITASGFATPSDIPSASDNASAVWNSNSRTLTESALTAQDVWEYANRTLTTEQAITSDDISNIASGVWSANARTLTESIPTEESITAKVWTYPNRTLTEDLSGLYCTRQDVEQRWGKLNVAVMADAENDGDEFTISTHIKAAIIKATNRINSELASSIYSLPFSPVPDIVKQHAAALAGVELYRVRSVAVTNDAALFTAAETEFSNWVIAVYNGLQIPGARELPE